MPGQYCAYCGLVHKEEGICCITKPTTRAASKSTKMAKANVKEEGGMTDRESGPLSMEERRKIALQEIEQLELENEVLELEERRQKLLEERERRKNRSSAGKRDGGNAILDDQPSSKKEAAILEQTSTDRSSSEYSTYGRTSRATVRSRRRSSSSSGSRSSSRRRRSKWSLKRFTPGKKDLKRVNCYELICATTQWASGIKELSVADLRALMDHINFLANRAMHNDFIDQAHTDYDEAIRKLAEEVGFAAFAKENRGISVIHYGAQNMRSKKPVVGLGPYTARRPVLGNTKRPCYAWNSDGGCSRTEEDCRFGHVCSKCGVKGHRRQKCKD